MQNRIVIIHGLNNTTECFNSLGQVFTEKGYDVRYVTLPGHGEEREEAKDFKTAFRFFDRKMKEVIQEPYSVIAFSYGALYLQLWLEKNLDPKPNSQILLAPAIYIRRHTKIEKVMSLLPTFFFILSQTPKPFRRYSKLFVWEYRTLLNALKTYQGLKSAFKVPTLVMIDPKDELVDAKTLSEEIKSLSPKTEIIFQHREFKKRKALGQHHIMFHPEYFSPDEWNNLIKKMHDFIETNEEA